MAKLVLLYMKYAIDTKESLAMRIEGHEILIQIEGEFITIRVRTPIHEK